MARVRVRVRVRTILQLDQVVHLHPRGLNDILHLIPVTVRGKGLGLRARVKGIGREG